MTSQKCAFTAHPFKKIAPLTSSVCAAAAVVSFAPCLFAQETIRPSTTGAEAAEQRDQVTLPRNYTFKIGEVRANASVTLGMEFNDNVNLGENDRESDFIVRPGFNLEGDWQATKLNDFRISLGVGFAEYVRHSNLDSRSILISPGTALSFDVYVGDNLRLNFHDRLTILQNPIDEAGLSNVARFDRLENSAGITAYLDYDALKFVFGYDHFTYETLDNQFSYIDHQEEQLFGSASLQLSDALTAGLDSSFAYFYYSQNYNNNGFEWSAGPFVEATLSDYSKLRVSGGYQGMWFDGSGTSGDQSNFSGWYANLTYTQRLNAYWTHSVSVGREAELGLYTNYTDYYFARYGADWRVNSRLHLALNAFLEQANDSGGTPQASERSFRWGVGASVGWAVNRKLTLALQYQYANKDSDLPLRSYTQDSVLMTLNYAF